MKECCENQFCQNKAVKEVPVSVNKTSDQVRALCASCEESYTWGAQHSRKMFQQRQVWVMAVADSGLIVHAKAFNSKKDAEKALAEYLRCYENYDGPSSILHICDWLAEHDERQSVELCSTPVNPS
jgi:hypothetical protein